MAEDAVYELPLRKVRRDGGTQSRAGIFAPAVDKYAAALKATPPAVFPPGVVFFDGADDWLAHGFHRFEAHLRAGRKTMSFVRKHGDVLAARLYSAGCNITNPVQRTHADERAAVALVLTIPECRDVKLWPHTRIARHCGVSEFLVRTMRTETNAREREAAAKAKAKAAQEKEQQESGQSAPRDSGDSIASAVAELLAATDEPAPIVPQPRGPVLLLPDGSEGPVFLRLVPPVDVPMDEKDRDKVQMQELRKGRKMLRGCAQLGITPLEWLLQFVTGPLPD